MVSGDALIENAESCVPADDFRFAVPNRDGFQPLPVHGPEVELLRLGAPLSEILLCLRVVTRRNLIRSSHSVSRLTPTYLDHVILHHACSTREMRWPRARACGCPARSEMCASPPPTWLQNRGFECFVIQAFNFQEKFFLLHTFGLPELCTTHSPSL